MIRDHETKQKTQNNTVDIDDSDTTTEVKSVTRQWKTKSERKVKQG